MDLVTPDLLIMKSAASSLGGGQPPKLFYIPLKPTVGVFMHSWGFLSSSCSLVSPSIASAIAPLVTDAHPSDSLPDAMSFSRDIVLVDNWAGKVPRNHQRSLLFSL